MVSAEAIMITIQKRVPDQTMEKETVAKSVTLIRPLPVPRLDPNQTFRRLFVIGGEKFLSCSTAATKPRAKFQGERDSSVSTATKPAEI